MSMQSGILFRTSVLGFPASHQLRPEHQESYRRRYGPFRDDGRTCSRWNHDQKFLDCRRAQWAGPHDRKSDTIRDSRRIE